MAVTSLDQLRQRLDSLQSAFQENAAAYEERETGESGSEPKGKRWGELSAAYDDLAHQVEDVAGELNEVSETYQAELEPGSSS